MCPLSAFFYLCCAGVLYCKMILYILAEGSQIVVENGDGPVINIIKLLLLVEIRLKIYDISRKDHDNQ